MELKLGIMTNAELAEWFGIKERSFNNVRAKKLEDLKEYADFEVLKGKINVLNIKIPVFIKKKSRNYQIISKGFEKYLNPDGLDTLKRISDTIVDEESELDIAANTAYCYTADYAKEAYGVTNSNMCGTKGCRNYEFGKWVDGCEYPVAFTEEENEIKKGLLKKYFGDTEEKQVFVKNLIKTGELKEEEAWRYYERISNLDHNYKAFLDNLEAAIGHKVVRATRFMKMTQLGK